MKIEHKSNTITTGYDGEAVYDYGGNDMQKSFSSDTWNKRITWIFIAAAVLQIIAAVLSDMSVLKYDKSSFTSYLPYALLQLAYCGGIIWYAWSFRRARKKGMVFAALLILIAKGVPTVQDMASFAWFYNFIYFGGLELVGAAFFFASVVRVCRAKADAKLFYISAFIYCCNFILLINHDTINYIFGQFLMALALILTGLYYAKT